ncbi:SIR2 family NAD-dependent protein deacylase [Scrofimicrobium sp. R131]|uniref:protein acetyllysine N-acetyltransferase n=1 Tax=Scrofimicrobium appendicitidis TaxID=3079930 RepID=A0AAU7V4Z6_9ACTO
MSNSSAERLVDLIRDARQPVFFGGAGVSTESGLPDFRSAEARQQTRARFGVSPEQILSASFFAAHPETFYRYLHEFLLTPGVEPNRAHRVLAKWGTEIVTQNIDGLHQAAGSDPVWELHGTLATSHCLDCGRSRPTGPIRCECGGLLKPDIVLYEEALPAAALRGAAAALAAADLILVAGTSLNVYPAAGLIPPGTPLAVVNLEPVPISAEVVIHEPVGKVLAWVDDQLTT